MFLVSKMSKGKRNTVKAKRKRKENKEVIETTSPNSILKVTFLVLAFLCAFYLLTLYITHKNNPSSNNEESSNTVEDTTGISIGKSLSMDGEYYVLFYDKSNTEISSTYRNLVVSYSSLENALPIYTVDMGSAFHKSFVTEEESNKNPASEEEFKINGPTLIKVSNQKVQDYIEGEESIKETLK